MQRFVIQEGAETDPPEVVVDEVVAPGAELEGDSCNKCQGKRLSSIFVRVLS